MSVSYFCCCCQMALMACSAFMWDLQRSGCKVSHKEGCKPAQDCPIHSPRLSDVRQIWQPHSRVNAPPLVRHHIPMGPGYFQKTWTSFKPKLGDSQQFCYRKKNPPPACPSAPTALTGGQMGGGKCSGDEEGHVCMCSGTGATARKHTQVYVK